MSARSVVGAGLVLAALIVAAAAWTWQDGVRADSTPTLEQRVIARSKARADALRVACPDPQADPLVLVVLGQSNAANHGPSVPPDAPTITAFDGASCLQTGDPMPGATGNGQSLWPRVVRALQARGLRRPVVVAVFAVESTQIQDWTDEGRALRPALEHWLSRLRQAGLEPDLVLWQQGEADARAGTTPTAYSVRLASLVAMLRPWTGEAPVLAAMSTRCRSGDGAEGIRAAIRQATEGTARVRPGPDTDLLAGPMRADDCHFSESGLDAAAALWADAITPLLPARR